MKAHVTRGAGFRGALNYDFGTGDKEGRGQLIGGNMSGTTPRELSSEFAAARKLRPDCKRPVWRCSLSLPPGEDVTDERFSHVARQHLVNIGMDPDNRPWALVRHGDTRCAHVHLTTSRVGWDGSLWHGQHEALKVIESAQQLEKQFNLTLTPGLNSKEPNVRISRDQLEAAARKGAAPHHHPKLQVAARLDQALARSSTLDELKTEAAKLGVETRFATNSGGLYGVSFKLTDDEKAPWLKGSQVGKGYTSTALLRRLAGDADAPAARAGQRVRQDILDRLARERQGDREIVRWASGHVAAVATDVEIRFRTGSAAESAVCAALARERGWQSVELGDRGSKEKNEAAIAAYQKQGIEVRWNGKTYPPRTKDEGLARWIDAGSPAPSPAGGAAPTPSAGALGSTAKPVSDAARPVPPDAAAPAADAGRTGPAPRRPAGADPQNRPDLDPNGKILEGEKVMDSLAFLNDETETLAAPLAPTLAPAAAPQKPAAGPGPQATDEGRSAALERALAREMARRRWARAEEIAVDLEGRRQELEWHRAQKFTSRLMSIARGQQALLRGEIARLEQAHRQALAREKGLRQHLKSDPISSSLINEEALVEAKERAERFEEAARAAAAREAQAEAQRDAALLREREALRQRDAEKEDEAPRSAKKKASGAPKPR